MKHSIFAWLVIFVLSLQTIFADDVASAQKRAVAAFPELAKPDSPLHRKFLELYEQEKAQNSKLLLDPAWPEVLARRAAAVLAELSPLAPKPFIVLEPTDLYYSTVENTTFNGVSKEKVVPHRLQLPAKLFAPGEALLDVNAPAGNKADIWGALVEYARALRSHDLAALKAIVAPEASSYLATKKSLDDAGRLPVEVRGVLNFHGEIVAFVRRANSRDVVIVLEPKNGGYKVAGPMYIQGEFHQIVELESIMENNDPRSLAIKPTDPETTAP